MTEGKAVGDYLKKVLFIYTANVCRTPMAEAMFNALAEDRDLGCQAESAGVRVLKGEPVALASAALEEVGIYVEDHRARQVSETMLEGTILVLAMGSRYGENFVEPLGIPLRLTSCPGTQTAVSVTKKFQIPMGAP